MRKLWPVCGLALSLLAASCANDSREELAQPATNQCDTSAISYNTHVAPLLSNNCYSCHSNAQASSAGGGTSLEGYSNARGKAVGVLTRIQLPVSDPQHMPLGGGMLPTCEVNKIKAWINQGYAQ